MPYDQSWAQIMRSDLCDVIRISENNVFGGIAFVYAGHMLGGIHKFGDMFCAGKEQEADAKAIEYAGDMMFKARKMGGQIDIMDEAFVDDDPRLSSMGMALRRAQSLPLKY